MSVVHPERSLAAVVACVRETIDRYGLLAAGERVLLACSGGPDSVALLALLERCALELELVVGHVDHGLRADSADDAEAVAALAAGQGLRFVQRRLALDGVVSEDTARRGRLAALEDMADEVGAGPIALGHTADDQLETLIMRLCRGAGLTGLAGMAPRRGRWVRPMLEIGRRSVVATLEALEALEGPGWSAREDPTNRSSRYFRNRVRRDVVPLLKKENPRLLEAVTRTTRGVREELEGLAHYEDLELQRLGLSDPEVGGETVDVAGLSALPRGVASRILRRLWRTAALGHGDVADGPAAELGRSHVERVLSLLGRDTGPRVELPGGVVAYRQYDRLVLAPADALLDPGDVELEVPGPGVYPLEGLALVLEASSADPPGGPWRLSVRNLRPGDRVVSGAGTKKLSDLLVDRKIPRGRRRRLPLVVLAGEIVWIPGVWHRVGVVTRCEARRATLLKPRVDLWFG